MQPNNGWLAARWAAPSKVIAGTTQRYVAHYGGASPSDLPVGGNYGLKVGDVPAAVVANRSRLRSFLQEQQSVKGGLTASGSSAEPQIQWLDQVHGHTCIYVDSDLPGRDEHPPKADAMWTDLPDIALAIQSADCVPVVLTDAGGEVIAAAHGGWRGLTRSVLAVLIEAMPTKPKELCAWVGPCIGPAHFEVAEDVWGLMVDKYSSFVLDHPTKPEKRFLDLPNLARHQLWESGVMKVALSGACTYASEDFYSHRRATHENGRGAQTGRMATVIYRGG
ncbi:MAG: peptidoglycan editing factor PgeF [Pseudomonadota bacterium]|nr:peptidoglycan editing factor PgeF [Pseudomonadota bacterium]